MRNIIRALPLALAAALLAIFALACSGGGGGGDSSYDSGGDTGSDGGIDFVSASPQEVLAASVGAYSEDVTSLEADLDFGITTGTFTMEVTGHLAFQGPDSMHATMSLTGLGEYEMLLLGSDIYVNIPVQGWVVFSLEDLLGGLGTDTLGADPAAFESLFDNRSFVDYSSLLSSLGGEVEDLGEEEIDGVAYRHYRTTVDFADLAASFSDVFGATSDLGLESVSGPLTVDAWVDQETLLPHELTTNGEVAFGADTIAFEGTIQFSNFNQTVDIPQAPADAIPFADFLGSFGE